MLINLRTQSGVGIVLEFHICLLLNHTQLFVFCLFCACFLGGVSQSLFSSSSILVLEYEVENLLPSQPFGVIGFISAMSDCSFTWMFLFLSLLLLLLFQSNCLSIKVPASWPRRTSRGWKPLSLFRTSPSTTSK